MLLSTRNRMEWLNGNASSSDFRKVEKSWASLWRIKIPDKIKLFVWRLAKQSLPTADVRHHRHMPENPKCSLCRAEENWKHSLLLCTMSKCVWVLVDEEITEHLIIVQESDARSWIFSLIETLKHDDLIRVLVTLWEIWYAPRKAIHDNIFQSPLSTFLFVNSFISDLTMAEGKKGVHVQQGHTQKAGWIPPPEGLVKINVDAATSKNTNRGAIAAVATGEVI
jgi:hypothetical protein